MPDPNPITTVEFFRQVRQALAGDEAEAEARELFDRLLGLSHGALLAFPERIVSAPDQARVWQAVQRRQQGEPLAYVLGCRGFWSFDLEVSPATLIPRSDTERLVELALERIPMKAEWRIADLGTGSGAIALALAKERPHCQLIATDASPATLAIARRNARRLQLHNLQFVQARWLAGFADASFDLIVSNPPYIADTDPHLQQGDLPHEPRSALASGHDGLDDIRQISQQAATALRPGGWLLLEHGWDQAEAVRALLQRSGLAEVCTERDYGGTDRVTAGCLK